MDGGIVNLNSISSFRTKPLFGPKCILIPTNVCVHMPASRKCVHTAHIRSRALNWIQYGFKNAWHYSNPWVSYIEINAEIFFDCISRTLSVWKSWAIQMEYWKWNVRNLWNKTNSAITRFKRKYPTHPRINWSFVKQRLFLALFWCIRPAQNYRFQKHKCKNNCMYTSSHERH